MFVGCLCLNPPNSVAKKFFFLFNHPILGNAYVGIITNCLEVAVASFSGSDLLTETNKEENRTIKQYQNISKNVHPLHNIVATKTIYILLAAVNATLFYRAKYPAPPPPVRHAQWLQTHHDCPATHHLMYAMEHGYIPVKKGLNSACF